MKKAEKNKKKSLK